MSERYILRSTTVASRMLGSEAVLMSSVDSTLYSLSEVGAVIWQSADGSTPLSEIVLSRICKEFDVPVDRAHADALAFVDELARHGILHVSDVPMNAAPILASEPVPASL